MFIIYFYVVQWEQEEENTLCEEKVYVKCLDIFKEFGDNYYSNLVVEKLQVDVVDKYCWLGGIYRFLYLILRMLQGRMYFK